MPKQGENPLWDYFKISNEDVSKAVCILCKKDFINREQEFSQNDNNNKKTSLNFPPPSLKNLEKFQNFSGSDKEIFGQNQNFLGSYRKDLGKIRATQGII